MERINVTKIYLPPIEEYIAYLQKIWDNGWLTNQGPLLKQFEQRVEEHLQVKNLQFVNNGTTALQLAINVLDLQGGEIITTPFSFVATTSAILWEKYKPVFVDIESKTFCIDAEKIESAITPKTKAILAVHVFGNPCEVERIEEIARKHDLKVIYDAAHSFGVKYKGRSLLEYGDISTLSFHATKLFHTVEGGAVIAQDSVLTERLDLLKRFGFNNDDYLMLGINAKNSEMHAAMGLCCLDHIDKIIAGRKRAHEHYDKMLQSFEYLRTPFINPDAEHNYSYYPVIFESEEELNHAIKRFNIENIYPRRYFYPSLNTLPYLNEKVQCPVSEDISKRILCLPLYPDLSNQDIERICKVLISKA